MGASAEALRVPGKPSGHRSEWLALAAFVVAAGLAVALVLATSTPTTNVPVPRPAQAPVKVVPVNGDGVRVGGTSVYRYHPLPATNVFVGSEGAAGGGVGGAAGGGASGGEAPVRVGGHGPYAYHLLP